MTDNLDILAKEFLAALDDKHVKSDAKICIEYNHSKRKLRAYCPDTGTWLQFPNALRSRGATYTADVIEVPGGEDKTTFYRVVKGTIKDTTGRIVG